MTATAPTERPPSPREVRIAKAVRRRRWFFYALGALAAAVALLCIADRLGVFGYRGDDLAKFDGRTFTVIAVEDAETLAIDARGHRQSVRLLGIRASHDSQLAKQAMRLLHERTLGKRALLRLDGLTHRDPAGQLLAYAFVPDGVSLNELLIREGLARADSSTPHSYSGAFAAAESTARRKKLGIWAKGGATPRQDK